MKRLRDFDARPYSPDEARVAAFFAERGIGGGDDPIGAILAGYAWIVSERNTAQEAIKIQSQLLAEANAKIEGWKEVYNQADKSRDEAMDRLSATLSLLAEAREALEPFAKFAERIDGNWKPKLSDGCSIVTHLGDCRTARGVLAKLKAASGE